MANHSEHLFPCSGASKLTAARLMWAGLGWVALFHPMGWLGLTALQDGLGSVPPACVLGLGIHHPTHAYWAAAMS